MPSLSFPALARVLPGTVMLLTVLCVCPPLWGNEHASNPKVLRWLWQKHVIAQLTGLDLTWDGRTVAFTVAPSGSEGESQLFVVDESGHQLWTTTRAHKLLGVSLSSDGHYTAIGLQDFSIALFSKRGELLWQRKSLGLPLLSARAEVLIAFSSSISGAPNALVEVFLRSGKKEWTLRRKGRVWRGIASDRNDLLISQWSGEVLLIDQSHRIMWQRMVSKDVMALAMSPEDAEYLAIGTGVLDQGLHLFERTGRLVWRRPLPAGATEVSLAKRGEFLLSYSNSIHGQRVSLYEHSGKLRWTYQLNEPAAENSKAVIVPDQALVIAGVERDQKHYLQGFALTGELLWVAPVPGPIFDFRVSRDGHYVAAATDHGLYFYDTWSAEASEARLKE